MIDNKKVTNLNLVKNKKKSDYSKVSALSPREIVSELDRYVIGQKNAKKADIKPNLRDHLKAFGLFIFILL